MAAAGVPSSSNSTQNNGGGQKMEDSGTQTIEDDFRKECECQAEKRNKHFYRYNQSLENNELVEDVDNVFKSKPFGYIVLRHHKINQSKWFAYIKTEKDIENVLTPPHSKTEIPNGLFSKYTKLKIPEVVLSIDLTTPPKGNDQSEISQNKVDIEKVEEKKKNIKEELVRTVRYISNTWKTLVITDGCNFGIPGLLSRRIKKSKTDKNYDNDESKHMYFSAVVGVCNWEEHAIITKGVLCSWCNGILSNTIEEQYSNKQTDIPKECLCLEKPKYKDFLDPLTTHFIFYKRTDENKNPRESFENKLKSELKNDIVYFKISFDDEMQLKISVQYKDEYPKEYHELNHPWNLQLIVSYYLSWKRDNSQRGPPEIQNENVKSALIQSLLTGDLAAAEKIFKDYEERNDSPLVCQKEFLEVVELALLNDQTEFLQLFYEKGLRTVDFLTDEILKHLYFRQDESSRRKEYDNPLEIVRGDDILRGGQFVLNGLVEDSRKYPCHEAVPEKDLKTIGKVISDLTYNVLSNFYDETASNEEDINCCVCCSLRSSDKTKSFRLIDFKEKDKQTNNKTGTSKHTSPKYVYTDRDLFLWALLTCRFETAKFYWVVGIDQIEMAILAVGITRKLAAQAREQKFPYLEEEHEKTSRLFEYVANSLLTEIAIFNYPCSALLTRSTETFGKKTILSLTHSEKCLHLGHNVIYQRRLNFIWRRGIYTDKHFFLVVVNIFIPIIFLKGLFHLFCCYCIKSNKVDSNEDSNLESFDEDHDSIKKFGTKIRKFYEAPITKFTHHILSFVCYLFLITVMALTEFHPMYIGPVEIIVWIWTLDMFVEELSEIGRNDSDRKTAVAKVKFQSYWNIFEMVYFALMGVIFIIRMCIFGLMRTNTDETMLSHLNESFLVPRILLNYTMALMYLRLMQFYDASKPIGILILVVQRMAVDVLKIITIYLVCVIAFGVVVQGLKYPNSALSFDVIKNLVYYPYWQTYGDLNLDYLEGNDVCSYSSSPNCWIRFLFILFAFVIFMVAVNILLLNLLIAMLTNTYESMRMESEKQWAYRRYSLVEEYYYKPVLPPPFAIITIFVSFLITKCLKEKIEKRNKFYSLVAKLNELDSLALSQLFIEQEEHLKEVLNEAEEAENVSGESMQISVNDSEYEITGKSKQFKVLPDNKSKAKMKWRLKGELDSIKSDSKTPKLRDEIDRLDKKTEDMKGSMQEKVDQLVQDKNTLTNSISGVQENINKVEQTIATVNRNQELMMESGKFVTNEEFQKLLNSLQSITEMQTEMNSIKTSLSQQSDRLQKFMDDITTNIATAKTESGGKTETK